MFEQELEQVRVEKELANIRTKFKNGKSLTAYDKKKCVPLQHCAATYSVSLWALWRQFKLNASEWCDHVVTKWARGESFYYHRYVWKLLYIFMLGYDVDFGHMEVVGLITSPKYAEKQVGYTVTSVLLNEHHDFLRLVINSIRNDVISRNETFQCLALSLISNVGGKEFADSLAGDVQSILVSNTVRPIVRKKAALCLLRLYRKNHDILVAETWAQRMANLLEERDLGILTGVLSLLLGIASQSASGYEACVPKVITVMDRLVKASDIPVEYMYYALPSPWLQVKCMRVLRYFQTPEDPTIKEMQKEARTLYS